jgi:hypothetical protein
MKREGKARARPAPGPPPAASPPNGPKPTSSSALPGANPLKDAHAALDAAVLGAYGFSPKEDLLAQLLALNLDFAARIARGDPVTAPGVPTNYSDPAKLVTEDRIKLA